MRRKKEFNSIKSLQMYLSRIKKPKEGYNKFFLDVYLDNGNVKNVRYNHGKNDPSLREQLNYHLRRN